MNDEDGRTLPVTSTIVHSTWHFDIVMFYIQSTTHGPRAWHQNVRAANSVEHLGFGQPSLNEEGEKKDSSSASDDTSEESSSSSSSDDDVEAARTRHQHQEDAV
eukprot:2460255-Amphidinium_carterae.2